MLILSLFIKIFSFNCFIAEQRGKKGKNSGPQSETNTLKQKTEVAQTAAES